MVIFFFFFFQAEDGIRDVAVTGVQTCALPILTLASGLDAGASAEAHALARYRSEFPIFRHAVYLNTCSLGALGDRTRRRIAEFFEIGRASCRKSVDLGGRRIIKKKKRGEETSRHQHGNQEDAQRTADTLTRT